MIRSRRTTEIRNKAELTFSKMLKGLWFWQPKTFKLSNHLGTYRPDFYSVEKDRFYEVVGTRQAFSLQRAKIDQFRKDYPGYNLEIVNIGAYINGPRPSPRKQEVKRKPGHGLGSGRKASIIFDPGRFDPFVQRAESIRTRAGLSVDDFSVALGFSYTEYRRTLGCGRMSKRMVREILQRYPAEMVDLQLPGGP